MPIWSKWEDWLPYVYGANDPSTSNGSISTENGKVSFIHMEEMVDGAHIVPYKPMQYYVVFSAHFEKPAKPPVSVGDFFGNPLHLVDNKVVRVWELYRPSLKDAAVVAFSPTLSAMVQCNTAVYLLGSAIWLYGQIHGQRQTWY